MAKGASTRARNILLIHIQSGVEDNTVLASKNTMDDWFSKLEEAHLKYLEAAQVNIDDNQKEANYLNQPGREWEDAHKMYGDFLKERSDMEKIKRIKEVTQGLIGKRFREKVIEKIARARGI